VREHVNRPFVVSWWLASLEKAVMMVLLSEKVVRKRGNRWCQRRAATMVAGSNCDRKKGKYYYILKLLGIRQQNVTRQVTKDQTKF